MSTPCPSCGERIGAGERFCTRCGTAVPAGPPQELAPAPAAGGQRWTRGAKAAAASLAAALLLAAAGAAALWLELSTALEEKQQVEAWLAASRSELDETEARLAEAEALSSRRKAVLVQTDRVLAQVDPLLTAVDRMKAVTARMSETQESFAGNATSVISSLATLLDYVVDVDPLYWDLPYIYGLLDDVRSGVSAADADQARFESLERQYARASRVFEGRATRYVRAVERLEGQLQKVTG